ncbi:MAG: PH domain-containing protein [Clostridia bacterium]|nr:PH domain-containing protein [Clostridia bacterium]
MKNETSASLIWSDRKRTLFGLPWSFTRYYLYENKLIIDTGFFSRKEEEIRLYRIMDISLKRTLEERLFGLGTIHCCSGDKTAPEFNIKRIKLSREVKERLSDMVESERQRRRVGTREYMDSDIDGEEEMHE